MIEDAMLEHYEFIIKEKDKELAQLYRDIRYREQELAQLREMLYEMTIILK